MVTSKSVKPVVKKPAAVKAATKPVGRPSIKAAPVAALKSAVKPATKSPAKPVLKSALKATPNRAAKLVAKPAATKSAKPALKPLAKALIVTKPIAPKAVLSDAKPASSIKPLADSKVKVKKAKLVRDSFTMPADEYQVLGDVKKLFLKAGLEVKKSELLRVGVALIRDLNLANLKVAVASLPPVKAGRPKKEK